MNFADAENVPPRQPAAPSAVKSMKPIVVKLAPFQQPASLSFGNVRLGQTKRMRFHIENPSILTDQVEFLNTSPLQDKGFRLIQPPAPNTLHVLANSHVELEMEWAPRQVANVRACLGLRSSLTGQRFQVFLLGFGVNGAHDLTVTSLSSTAQVKRKAFTVTASGQPQLKKKEPLALSASSSIVNAATLSLQKPAAKVNPKSNASTVRLQLVKKKSLKEVNFRPMPFITKPDMYEEHWAERQEKSFVKWLNYELTGGDWCFAGKTTGSSFNQFSESLKRKHVVLAASRLYQSEVFEVVLKKLLPEIHAGRIAIREDCDVVADVGLREELTNMLLSFSSVWLALGLEVIVGRTITDYGIKTLSHIIQNYLHMDEGLHSENETMSMAYRQEFKIQTQKAALKKLLVLVLLLDKAKVARMVPGDPCLFHRDAKIKSTREVILVFSNRCLSGEGDIMRHLLHLGYTVSHVQKPLDEFNYTVNNLATDLRDGVRLARLVELHTSDHTLHQKLKYPATTTMQMTQNVQHVLNALQSQIGFSEERVKGGQITAKDIVDSHREKTLMLLWKLAFLWKVSVMLNEDQLRLEIALLKRKHPSVDQDELEQPYFQSSQISLLFEWCRAVCTAHGVPVHNFTSSFGDGRALCMLVGHYHPDLLPLGLICHPRPAPESLADETFVPNQPWSQTFSPGRKRDEPLVARNFQLFNQALLSIGGIPVMLSPTHSLLQDEKSIIMTVTYLCARLMTLRQEIRASQVIQRVYRKYRLHKLLHSRVKAARVICRTCETYLLRRRFRKALKQRVDSASTIQSAWRLHKQRQAKQSEERILKMQAVARGFIVRRSIERQHDAALVIQRAYWNYLNCKAISYERLFSKFQASCRGFLVRRHVQAQTKAATDIQRLFRGYRDRKAIRLVRTFIALQAQCRGKLVRAAVRHQLLAVIRIQTWIRMKQTRQRYIQTYIAVIILQRWFRSWKETQQAQSAYQLEKQAAITIQRYVRGWIARRQYQSTQEATILLQQRWRLLMVSRNDRWQFMRIKLAAIQLQRRFRAKKQAERVRAEYLADHHRIVLVQSLWRMNQAQKRYLQVRSSALVVQKYRRGHVVRREYSQKRSAVTLIASTFRMFQQRRRYHQTRRALVLSQAHCRGYLVRKQIAKHKAVRQERLSMWSRAAQRQLAAIRIQRIFRKHQAIQKARAQLHAITAIQGWWRACMVRRQFHTTINSIRRLQMAVKHRHATRVAHAVVLQRFVRSALDRLRFLHQRRSALIIQSIWRGYRVRKQSNKLLAERRRRIREINAAAEEHMKLGNRAQMALELLLTSTQMSVVLKACAHLDVATRLSRNCCVRLVDHDAINILFKLIKSCNRSKPHMEVLKHTVNILKHMSMYPETAPSVFVVPQGAVEVMIDLLQNFRESDEHGIYVTVAKTLLLQNRYESSVVLLKKTKDGIKRLTNIQAMMDRKLALDVKAKRLPSERKSKLYEATVLLRPLLAQLNQ